MPNYLRELDSVFQALAHPVRRAVVERLASGPAGVSTLAEPHAMALPSFMQHLRVLERAGLVRTRKSGRVRMVEVTPESFRRAESWIAEQRRTWEARLDQLDAYVTSLKGEMDR